MDVYIHIHICIYLYMYIYKYILSRADRKCVPHGTLPWSECAGPRYTPPRGPLGEGSSVGDPRPGLPGLGGSGRMGNHAPGCVCKHASSGTKSTVILGPNRGPSYGCGGGPKAGWRYLDRVSRLSTLGPHVLWQSGPSVHTLGVQPAEGWAATNSARGALAGPLS